MKIVISEGQYKRIITEQEETSDQTCSKSVSTSPTGVDRWSSLNDNDKRMKSEAIKSDIRVVISRCVNEYIKWFTNPQTISKFKGEREKNVLRQVPSFLRSIKNINLTLGGPSGRDTVIAWVSSKNLTLINYNLLKIHNTEKYIGAPLYEITKHEMGHLIDYFFKKNGVKTYIQTIDTSNQESYNANYLINDGDQYSRLNYLRQLIGAGPADSPQQMLGKFLNKVSDGTVTSDKFNISGFQSQKPNKPKNDINTAKSFAAKIEHSILVKGKPSMNIGQLFSTFAVGSGSDIIISFDLIAQLNYTSKDVNRKYYYLKLSPK